MRKMIFALAAGLALLGSTSAWAQSLDFNVSGGSGSISYAGGAADLVATGIGVAYVTPIGTPLHSGIQLPYSPAGTLAFTTGAYTSAGSNSTTWNFGGGGAITISGTLTPNPPDTGTQLSGTILSATVTNVGGVENLAVAVFVNTIDATLASYLGVPTTGWKGALHIDFSPASTNTAPSTGTAFTSTLVGSGDVTTVVPEPSTMAIAGLGALGMIGYGIRRRKGA